MMHERIAGYAAELKAIRHDLHRHPELLFDLPRTSGIVAAELARLGCQVATGWAGTGVIGTLRQGTGGKVMGIRADMDALPIHETTNLPYASRNPGKMHACGHDGHTATLLGAARYLAETRDFDGTVHLIFQPAEEDISGAKRMIEEGFLKAFPCDAIFAFHNLPGLETGALLTRPGAITAAVDIVNVRITGVGGHGAIPHKTVDPIVAASGIVVALQSVVARNVDPLDPAVVTVGSFHSGAMATVIPAEALLEIGIRTCSTSVRDTVLRRVRQIIESGAAAFGCGAEYLDIGASFYPAGSNTEAETALVLRTAADLGLDTSEAVARGPFMFSEDFSYFQELVPTCYFTLGNGDSRNLHDPGYDFNDALLLKGAAFWGRLTENFLPRS